MPGRYDVDHFLHNKCKANPYSVEGSGSKPINNFYYHSYLYPGKFSYCCLVDPDKERWRKRTFMEDACCSCRNAVLLDFNPHKFYTSLCAYFLWRSRIKSEHSCRRT